MIVDSSNQLCDPLKSEAAQVPFLNRDFSKKDKVRENRKAVYVYV